MPSHSYKTFNNNIKQVDKLLLAYDEMLEPKKGRKALDHFTRAALIFLCSSWEVYIEQIAVETSQIITQKTEHPSALPLQVKKELAKSIKASKNELMLINFADDWKQYYISKIEEYTSKLNTPKKGNIVDMFSKYIGVEKKTLEAEVPTIEEINEIISVRGDIAHNVYAESYLTKNTVEGYRDTITETVTSVEKMLWNYLPTITDGKRPWQNTYKK